MTPRSTPPSPRNPRRLPAGRRAFTLVEAVATMVVISTLGSAAALVIARASDAYKAAATLGQIQTELSAAIDRVEREVRLIRHKSGKSAADISGATASSLSWNSSVGARSLSLYGGQLLLATAGGAGQAILNDVTSLTVQCYDESGAALAATLSATAAEAVRRVAVTAVVSRYGSTATLRTGIYLRSTMTGAE